MSEAGIFPYAGVRAAVNRYDAPGQQQQKRTSVREPHILSPFWHLRGGGENQMRSAACGMRGATANAIIARFTAGFLIPHFAAMPNHLATESSPYLLQHQNNPVNWYPWGP